VVKSAVSEAIICLDTGVWIKFLVAEEPLALSDAANQIVLRSLANDRLVAPNFAWAEVGSVLRKKVRQRLLTPQQASDLWMTFGRLPIEYVDTAEGRRRAWELAERYELPTLYDAAFLVCPETVPAQSVRSREFWTADQALIRALEKEPLSHVHWLGELAGRRG
jgi:predicted nucleic acid-binding protein